MLWLKALHLAFMVCWFAGLFYLPRLFVYHAMATEPSVREQLCVMERRLYRFVSPFAALTVGLGLWLLALNPAFYLSQGWMLTKLGLVLLLVVYHLYCGHLLRELSAGRSTRSHRYFRIFNELPVLILFPVVILAVVRPF
ncbi:MAG: protoporphyrinogen oxidase HemJ [Gammaproteobacteria bacterium]|nr:MAG: protoporphyrinogen oxidase HemJ [Gammaproteobacteria bacterium]